MKKEFWMACKQWIFHMERYCGTGIPTCMSLFVCNLWLIFHIAGGNFYITLLVVVGQYCCYCTFHIAYNH